MYSFKWGGIPGQSDLVLASGNFIIRENQPSSALFSTSVLYYQHPAAIKLTSLLNTDGTITAVIVGADSLPITFSVEPGKSVGAPSGHLIGNDQKLLLLDNTGAPLVAAPGVTPRGLRILYPNGSSVYISTVSNIATSYRTAGGRDIVFSTLPAESALKIVTKDGSLRQIKAAAGLADLVPMGAQGFQIRLYSSGSEGALNGTTGLYQPTGDPYRTIFFENPSAPAENYDTVMITDVWGSQTRIDIFRYDSVIDDWTLSRGGSGGAGAVGESKTFFPGPNNDEFTYRTTLRDSAKKLISTREEVYRRFPWGKAKILEVLEPNTLNLRTTYEYYESTSSTGYGKLRRVDKPDGTWETYEYDSHRRLQTKTTPWKDSGQKKVTCAYASHEAADTVETTDFRPRTETETVSYLVDDVLESYIVGRTYHVYKTAANGQLIEIEERASSPTSDYGSATNLRTTRAYHTTDTADSSYSAVNEGKLAYEDRPDGTRTTYSYSENTAMPSAAFTTTMTVATPTSPAGVEGLSTRTVSTYNLQGHLIRRQSYIFVNAAWQPTSTEIDTVNAEGQTTASTVNGRKVYGATYDGRQKTSETDEYGVTTTFVYDAFDKVYTATRKGVQASGGYAAQADITTTYQRALGGISCGCDGEIVTTVASGSLSLSNTTRKDQIGRLVYEKDNAGLETNYIYTVGGRQITRLNPDGGTIVTLNFKDGRIQSVSGTGTDARTYDYGVNADGTQWVEVTLGARKERTTYDFLGRPAKIEQPAFDGGTIVTSRGYDLQGHLARTSMIHVAAGAGTETKLIADTLYVYDVMGNLTRTGLDVDGDGVLTPASADRITESQRSFAQYESAWWSVRKTLVYPTLNSGTSVQVSETRQRLSGFSDTLAEDWVSVDINGNLSRRQTIIDPTAKFATRTVVLPDSNITATQVTYNGLIVARNSATVSAPVTFSYDALGRVVTAKDPRKAHADSTTYDPVTGQISTIKDAAGNPTTVAYHPNGVAGAGRPSVITDALGKTRRLAYDLQGREIYQWGTSAYPQAVTYNALGALATSTTWRDTASADLNAMAWPAPTGGDVTTWVYDLASGVLTRKAYADGNGTDYAYDKANRPYTRTWSRRVDSSRVTTTLGYDPVSGNLASISYSDSTPSVSVVYDRLGQQMTVTDAAGTRSFDYDPARLALSGETLPSAFYGSRILTYDYQSTGAGLVPGRFGGYRLGTVSTPAQDFSASFGYDAQGRFESITSGAGAFIYAYTPNSDLLASVSGPQVIASYTYEPDRDVRTQVANAVGATSISRYTYEVDAIGRRSNRVQEGSVFGTSTYDRFDYNYRNEVTGSQNYTGTVPANYLSDLPNLSLARIFAYDPIGNRLSSSEGSASARAYAPNALNQYTAITTPSTVPSYDLEGNQAASGSGWYYTWDAENRLVNARNYATTPVSGSQKLDYVYDYKSRRIRRTLSNYSGSAWSATDDRKFIYQGWNVVAELAATTNSLQTAYTWGLDLSQSHQGAGGVGGLLAVTIYSPSAVSFFATYDGNGNASEYINSSGAAEAHFVYDAFGQTTEASGTNLGRFSYRFSTKFDEPLPGLYYYGFRYYNPSTGRWLNRDPIEERGGLNLYGYVVNASVNYLDSKGLKKVDPNKPKRYETIPWNKYLKQWKDSHPGLTEEQYKWAECTLAGGCIGATAVNIGAIPDLKNCFKLRDHAEKRKNEMTKDKCCDPQLYSIHLYDSVGRDQKNPDVSYNLITGEVDLSNWDSTNGRPSGPWNGNAETDGVNYDYGYVNPDGSITHANHLHNPKQKYFKDEPATPESGVGSAEFYRDNAALWSKSSPDPYGGPLDRTIGYKDFNTEVWCVQCKGNYGKN